MLHGVHCLLIKTYGFIRVECILYESGVFPFCFRVSQLLSRFEKFHGLSDVNSST